MKLTKDEISAFTKEQLAVDLNCNIDDFQKDGFIFKPTGYGSLDNAGLYEMAQGFDKKPQWYIMDHDCSYKRDIYSDLAMSLEFFRNLVKITDSDQ